MIVNLERGFSAYTHVDWPDTNYYGKDSLYAKMTTGGGGNDKSIYMFTPVTEAKGGVIPLNENLFISQAVLNLYVAQNLPVDTTVSVRRITEDWDFNGVTYNDEPAVTETNKATLLTSAVAGTYIQIDIKDMIQTVADNRETDGFIWFGFEITVNKDSECIFASWHNSVPNIRPYIELKYSVPPRQPEDLRPMGTIIGTLTPVLSALFVEDDPEDFCAKLQIQLHDSNDFSAPDYDSGTITTNKSSYMIEPNPVLVVGTEYFWRIRLGDSYGVWSPWSDPGSFTTLALPTVAITVPANANTRMPTNHDFASGVADWTLDATDTNVVTENQASVETDTTGFTLLGSTISRSDTEAAEGTYSLKTVTDDSAADEGFEIPSIDVAPSETHTASVELIGDATVWLEISEYNAGDGLIGTTQQAVDLDPTPPDDFARYSVSRAFGATGVKARIRVVTDIQQGCTFYADRLQLEQGASPGTAWHLPGSAAIKTSLYGEEEEEMTCGVTIYNGASTLTDISLYKDAGSVTDGDMLIFRAKLRTASLTDPTLRFRVIRAEAPWTEYLSESEEIDEDAEYYEFEYQIDMTETVPIRVICDMGGLATDIVHGVEFDWLGVNKAVSSRLPEITHTFTPGGNGNQAYVARELWKYNTVTTLWEQIGLHSLTPSAVLTHQVAMGAIKDDGDYKIVVKAQDGDLPREAIENAPVYGEDEMEFEVHWDGSDTGLQFDETTGWVRYEEHWSDLTFSGTWNGMEAEIDRASNGLYSDTDELDAYVEYTFEGTEVKWIGAKDDDHGIAEVFIDGVSQGTVDCYNAGGELWQQELFAIDGLQEEESVGVVKTHTIKVVCTHTKNAGSSDYVIDMDAFDVWGPNVPFPATDIEEIEMDLLDDDSYDYYRDDI